MSRVSEATVADWSFLQRPDVCDGISRIARRDAEAAGVDGEDLLQDLRLWLAVRPEEQVGDDEVVVLRVNNAAQSFRRKAASRRKVATFATFVPYLESDCE